MTRSATDRGLILLGHWQDDIERTERSALDPKAQPLQDVLDRMIYRMAGLTDAEANALEDRLEMML